MINMGVGQKCKLIAEQTKYMPGSRTTTSSNSTNTITPIHSRPCVALQIDAKIECVKTLRLPRTKVTASCNSTNSITPNPLHALCSAADRFTDRQSASTETLSWWQSGILGETRQYYKLFSRLPFDDM